ncbi:MAG: hypothetical protein EBS05_22220 [Proteobacteria bacterium]|nr:hypothetical protein [Pseudomonadota bacterium]
MIVSRDVFIKMLTYVINVSGALILAIFLAKLLLPHSRRSGEARIMAAHVQIAGFTTALNIFRDDTGFFPLSSESLTDLVQPPHLKQGWKGPYLTEIPSDPWQHAYVYVCPGRNNRDSFDLYSCGPDGLAGTEDDITNWAKNK